MTVNWFSISKALAVRCLLSFHVVLCVWRVVVDHADQRYWLLLCALLLLVGETCYTILRRHGVEFSRFTPCFACYLAAVLPGIWLLELNQTDLYIKAHNQTSQQESLSELKLNPETWIIVVEEMLPYVIFVCRWVLPRGRVRREELAELLFAFIQIASDIMEFFSLFGDKVIRSDKTLAYCLLSIWSLSVLQFTMTVTVVHQPKKQKKVKAVVVESNADKERQRVRLECFAIFLTMSMQDLPFAVMRLYTIINFSYVNYSLIFFTSKNLIIIMLLLYKICALCKKTYWPERDEPKSEVATRASISNSDHAEKGTFNYQNNLDSGSKENVHKATAWDRNSEANTQHNHSSETMDSVLKKRSHQTESSKRDSLDSGRLTPHSLARSRSTHEDTESRHSVYLSQMGSREHGIQFCASCSSVIEANPEWHSNSLETSKTSSD